MGESTGLYPCTDHAAEARVVSRAANLSYVHRHNPRHHRAEEQITNTKITNTKITNDPGYSGDTTPMIGASGSGGCSGLCPMKGENSRVCGQLALYRSLRLRAKSLASQRPNVRKLRFHIKSVLIEFESNVIEDETDRVGDAAADLLEQRRYLAGS